MNQPLKIGDNAALFLDFDGTLADIAPLPDAVSVPAATRNALEALAKQLGGALAIVTGRPIAEIDRFLHPLRLPVAGEHGAQVRLADGSILASAAAPSLGEPIACMEQLHAAHPTLLIERKPRAVALHYRQAPELEALCLDALLPVLEGRTDLALLRGKCVFEVKAAGIDKGLAITALMQLPPYSGRQPIFAGDDVTDEAGFIAVQALGGTGIKIGDGPTAATQRLAGPAEVRAWLAGCSHNPAAADSAPSTSPTGSAPAPAP